MKKIVSHIGVIGILLLSLNLPVYAVDTFPAELQAKLDELKLTMNDYEDCSVIIGELYDLETLKFFKFLETTFQNKSSASSLTNIAIAAYRDYKNNINNIAYSIYSNEETTEQIIDKIDELDYCRSLSDTYISLAKLHMIALIKNNGAQKSTAVLIEKLKSVNEKLRDLNLEVAEMYSFFATFRNKLPGFLKNCVTKKM
jgi:hypothetical protein